MNYTPTNEEIEMMKNNKEALCFWPERLQKWAKENCNEFGMLNESGKCDDCRAYSVDSGGYVYRLRPDYQLPKPERWFYWKEDHELESAFDAREFEYALSQNDCIEIPAADVEYVKKCIELHKAGKINLDEFEFRKVKKQDEYLLDNAAVFVASDYWCDDCIRFVRKPKKAESQAVIEWLERTLAELKGEGK